MAAQQRRCCLCGLYMSAKPVRCTHINRSSRHRIPDVTGQDVHSVWDASNKQRGEDSKNWMKERLRSIWWSLLSCSRSTHATTMQQPRLMQAMIPTFIVVSTWWAINGKKRRKCQTQRPPRVVPVMTPPFPGKRQSCRRWWWALSVMTAYTPFAYIKGICR